MEWLPLSQVLYDSDQDLVKIQISLIQVLILKWFGQMPSFIIFSVSLAEVANWIPEYNKWCDSQVLDLVL